MRKMNSSFDYINKEDFLLFLRDLGEGSAEDLKEKVEQYIDAADKKQVIRCKECAAFHVMAIQDGYGWCRKLCFGPEENFFCMLGEPIEHADESEIQKAEENAPESE